MKLFGIFDKGLERDFPSADFIAEHGIPQNTLFRFVPVSFLNGYVNHVNILCILLVERHKKFKKKDTDALITRLVKSGSKKDYSNAGNDVIVFAESANSYWFFWSDGGHTNHCKIGRIEKKKFENIDVMKQAFIDWIANDVLSPPGESQKLIGGYLELPLPKKGNIDTPEITQTWAIL